MNADAARAYPNECCRVIYGRDTATERAVSAVEPLVNAFEAGEQYHRFSISPRQLMDADRKAGARGELVLGFYHSHPDHPARPSEYDREHAWPFYSYVIVNVAKGTPGEMTSWELDTTGERFAAQPIRVSARGGPMSSSSSSNPGDYATPDVLVSTAWVADHVDDPRVKIVEVDVEPAKGYEVGHAPNAIGWNWQTDLCDTTMRDLIDPRAFAELCRRAGIRNDDTVVFYGDMNNWFAAWALWQFKYHGHRDARLMNGGRKKWELEGRPWTTDRPAFPRSDYKIPPSDDAIRAYRDEVMAALGKRDVNLVDVRSPDEFTGKVIAPPGMTETAQRGGHIPGARNVPWARTANEDGTFKSRAELAKLYTDAGVDLGKPTIAYCRIGERSSHTWFVLKYLLGATDVKNYDGSWTEWGNLVGAPIEKGEGAALPPVVKCE